MGLNLQSEEFWGLRPDNFIRMSRAYDMRQQLNYVPFRKLMYIVAKANGFDKDEVDIMPLPLIDGHREEEKPIILTAEEIREKQEFLKRIQNGS